MVGKIDRGKIDSGKNIYSWKKKMEKIQQKKYRGGRKKLILKK